MGLAADAGGGEALPLTAHATRTTMQPKSNTVASALLGMGMFLSSYWIVVGVTALFALGIILRYGTRRFERG